MVSIVYVPLSIIFVNHRFDTLRQSGGDDAVFELLRRAEHLAVVEINLIELHGCPPETPPGLLKERRRVWKKGLVDVLKSSPSKERKFLRWRVTRDFPRSNLEKTLEKGEFEVFPETSL